MGNRLRNKDPKRYRVITMKTVRGEMWMLPTAKNKRLLGGIIARYQEMFNIEIYSYKFLSNHYHLLVRAPGQNTDLFEENINREISRRINWKYNREGSLWARRYSDLPALDCSDVRDAFTYISLNAVRHGLVEKGNQWRGLNSYDHALNGRDREFSFVHYSKRDENGKPLVTKHKLKLSYIAEHAKLDKKKRKKAIRKLFTGGERRYLEERDGKPVLGQKMIGQTVPGAVPLNMKKSDSPSCYSKCPQSIREHCQKERKYKSDYKKASNTFRAGEFAVVFPLYSYHPPLHRKATPLSEEIKLVNAGI